MNGHDGRENGGPVRLTLFVRGGRFLGWNDGTYSPECDLAERTLRKLVRRELSGLPVVFEVRRWLDSPLEALARGVVRTPAVLVDGRVVEQGAVPERSAVVHAVLDRVAPATRGRLVARRLLRERREGARRRLETARALPAGAA